MAHTAGPRSLRPVIMGTQHMVSGGHYLATAAGVRSLLFAQRGCSGQLQHVFNAGRRQADPAHQDSG